MNWLAGAAETAAAARMTRRAEKRRVDLESFIFER